MDLHLLKKLFVSAALLMPCFFSYAQTTERSVELHFRQGSSLYEPDYRNNAERLRQFSDEIVSLQSAGYEVVRAEFQAGTSPEGPKRVNERLSQRRLRSGMQAFLDVIGDDIALHGDSLPVTSSSVGSWEELASSLEAGRDFEGRDAALDVLRDVSLDSDSKTSALKKLLGGGIWNYLTSSVFPDFRSSSITLRLSLAERLSDIVPAIPSAEISPVPVPIPSGGLSPLLPVRKDRAENAATPSRAQCEWTRKVRVGTNAAALALLMGNASAEVDITRNLSFHLPVYYSALNYFTSTIKFRTFAVQPELRWNFTQPSGLFVGAHFGLAYFNLATNGNWRIQTHNGDEPLIGGGLSVGYRLPLTKDRKWNIDFILGAGAYRFHYDKFYNEPNGALAGDVNRAYIGLDNAAISFTYSFDLGRGRAK